MKPAEATKSDIELSEIDLKMEQPRPSILNVSLLSKNDVVYLMNETVKQKRRLVVNICEKLLAFSGFCCLFKCCCMLNRQRKVKVKLLEKGAGRID